MTIQQAYLIFIVDVCSSEPVGFEYVPQPPEMRGDQCQHPCVNVFGVGGNTRRFPGHLVKGGWQTVSWFYIVLVESNRPQHLETMTVWYGFLDFNGVNMF